MLNVAVPPTVTLALSGCLVMTGAVGAADTVILKSFAKLVPGATPFSTIARIVTVPAEEAVKVLPVMVAAAPLTRIHEMVLLVASLGTIVPVRVSGVPAVAVVGKPVMSVTALKATADVEKLAAALAAEAKCVAVSTVRCVKL